MFDFFVLLCHAMVDILRLLGRGIGKEATAWKLILPGSKKPLPSQTLPQSLTDGRTGCQPFQATPLIILVIYQKALETPQERRTA